MTTPAFNASSLRVHPLDAPCVTLSTATSGPDPVRDRLLSVTVVKFQGSRMFRRWILKLVLVSKSVS